MRFLSRLPWRRVVLLVSVALAAHHGDAIYDLTAKNIRLKGTVRPIPIACSGLT
jgi:hypothetical protein